MGTIMRDVSPFSGSLPGSLAADQLPEQASATKPLYTKPLIKIKVLVFEENFFPSLSFLEFEHRIMVWSNYTSLISHSNLA
jgi:hypothetical protein